MRPLKTETFEDCPKTINGIREKFCLSKNAMTFFFLCLGSNLANFVAYQTTLKETVVATGSKFLPCDRDTLNWGNCCLNFCQSSSSGTLRFCYKIMDTIFK